MQLLTWKALHLIGIVSWFAGLFYIVRLYVYDVEAATRPDSERKILQTQLRIMQKRLWYGITWPALVLTILCGWVLADTLQVWSQAWFLWKALVLVLLVTYHLICGWIRKSHLDNRYPLTSFGLRLWNEVATVLLILLVFLAVTRNPPTAALATGIFMTFGVSVFGVLKIIRKK